MYKLFHNTTIQHCQIFTAVCQFWSNTNGGWWRWALVSPDGVAPSRMVNVSASINLPLHHKVRSSLLAPAHPSGTGKRAVKRLWWLWCELWSKLIIDISAAFDTVVWGPERASSL